MDYVKLFESWESLETIILTKGKVEILLISKHGKIEEIVNRDKIKIPFFEGQPVTIFVRNWACNHGFKWNGKPACQEEKVFGIKKTLIPQDHPIRRMYPSKFRRD